MKRIAIVTSHPIQYNAPLFKRLSENEGIELKVFYTWSQVENDPIFDRGFGKIIKWDIPLLNGYEFMFVKNESKRPGNHHFFGMMNPALIAVIKEWNPNVVVVYGWNYFSHFNCMRYFKGKIPVVFRGDSTLLDEFPGVKKVVRRAILKLVFSFVDYALYVGENNKEYFRIHGLDNNQLLYVPHVIDDKRFSSITPDKQTFLANWKEKLGINTANLVLLFAGKFEAKKDPFFIIELAKKMDDPLLRFIMVGNGILEYDLKLAASNDSRIIFIPFQNQDIMPVVYRLCDIFILPSKGPGETWGLALNEAMASGCRLMASSKVGGARDLISGWPDCLFENRDIQSAVDYLRRCLMEKKLNQFADTERGPKVEQYSLDNAVNKFVKSIDSIIQC